MRQSLDIERIRLLLSEHLPMKTHLFTDELWLPQPREDVFPFFAEARNLQTITPPWLDFDVVTPGTIRMREGVLIDYRLKVHGIPLRWRSEITAWDPPYRFVDEQRRGPYLYWRHEHSFVPSQGGTLCRDEVSYRVLGGALVDRFLVRKDVERIFAFRREAIASAFSKAQRRDAS